ncbi:MAG TPA: efflux RND transporter periplasmic adaptor subunit [Kiritimatiellia bacterium]|nr:efflux RND transporter periplasmic adaptor subunit [Kiritimatiellia bacterium]
MKRIAISKPRRSSVVIWTLIGVLLVMVVLSMVLRRAPEAMAEVEERTYPVRVMRVERSGVEDVLELPGRVEPKVQAQLATEKPGRITELLVRQGDEVSKGQVLLRLNDQVWRNVLAQAEIELREAKRDYSRWVELSRAGAVSTSDLDTARARLDRAEVQVLEALEHVRQCEVVSPGKGIINARYVEVGEHVPEGGAVFELVVVDPVKVSVDLPERAAGAVRPGDRLAFRAGPAGGEGFEAEVTFVAAVASSLNNSFRVEGEAPNPEGRLKPGMIATVRVPRGEAREVVSVPLASVIPRKGEHFVFVEREGRAVRRLVRLDRITGDRAVLASGLEEGEGLIVEGHRGLADGVRVERVTEGEG